MPRTEILSPDNTRGPSRKTPTEPSGTASVGQPPHAPGTADRSTEHGRGLPLPHERDQATGSADDAPREILRQAQRDIESGQVDTDLRTTPGLDAEQRERLVPPARGEPRASGPRGEPRASGPRGEPRAVAPGGEARTGTAPTPPRRRR